MKDKAPKKLGAFFLPSSYTEDMRALWKGWLSFGLINLPVNLYSAIREKELQFHLLHEKDLSPIRYVRICKKDGKEVAWEDIVKGYELENGDMVILTEEDFEKVNPQKVKTIEILDFSLEEEIDSIYFQKPYVLEPQKGASKAYILLREALKASKKVGICKFVLRNREHLGVIKPSKDFLILNQMRFVHELIESPSLEIPKGAKPSNKEIELAIKLIDQLSSPFRPKDYKDEYREELLEVIEKKAKGKRAKKKGKAPRKTKQVDIMKVLKKSLKKSAA